MEYCAMFAALFVLAAVAHADPVGGTVDAGLRSRPYRRPSGSTRYVRGRQCAEDQLVTLEQSELKNIVNAVADSKSRQIQKRFYECEEKEPERVLTALRFCQADIAGYYLNEYYDNIAKDPELIEQIYLCVKDKSTPLTSKERRQMVNFEDCARVIGKRVESTTSTNKYTDHSEFLDYYYS